jgi:hypothetical protein
MAEPENQRGGDAPAFYLRDDCESNTSFGIVLVRSASTPCPIGCQNHIIQAAAAPFASSICARNGINLFRAGALPTRNRISIVRDGHCLDQLRGLATFGASLGILTHRDMTTLRKFQSTSMSGKFALKIFVGANEGAAVQDNGSIARLAIVRSRKYMSHPAGPNRNVQIRQGTTR